MYSLFSNAFAVLSHFFIDLERVHGNVRYFLKAVDTREHVVDHLFLVDDFLWLMTVLKHSHKHVFCDVYEKKLSITK